MSPMYKWTPQHLKPDAESKSWRDYGRTGREFGRNLRGIEEGKPDLSGGFRQRKAAGPGKQQERDPTKGPHIWGVCRNHGVKMDGRRGTGGLLEGMRRSVSNRNGGSHMMLDNKTEQEWPLTVTDYETDSQGSFLFARGRQRGRFSFVRILALK